MKANFDGMRKCATANMNELHGVLQEVIGLASLESLEDDLKERIIEAFNNSAHSIDVMNCLYEDNL